MKFGSLFAGIGGFDLGLEMAGWECRWQVEKDEFCRKVLAKHWPDVPKYGDVKDVGKQNLEPVDLVCGGFPCQPYSVAGQRRGNRDDRALWTEMFRIISEIQPAWVICENVTGIISLALDQVLSDLESEGYACRTFIIPACAVNAPHRRDRVWVVACSAQNADSIRRRRGSHGNQRRNECTLQTERPDSGISSDSESTERQCSGDTWEWGTGFTDSHNSVTHDDSQREIQQKRVNPEIRGWSGNCHWKEHWYDVATGICRMDDGIPRRVDGHKRKRLKAIGNSVVPQIVAIIGKHIIETD